MANRGDPIDPKRPKAYEPWTDREDRALERMVAEGIGPTAISAALGRSRNAIYHRIELLGAKRTPK